MRGSSRGVLERAYLHSGVTEGLWYAVSEAACLFEAKLSHAVMLSSLYGNPSAKLDNGNDQIHEMYVEALNTLPYVKAATSGSPGARDALVEEWRRVNAEEAAKKAAAAADAPDGEEAGSV